jgi:hypothetical protein
MLSFGCSKSLSVIVQPLAAFTFTDLPHEGLASLRSVASVDTKS